MNFKEVHFENKLPKELIVSIQMFVDMKNRIADGEECLHWDCIESNLEADINFAEAHRTITSKQAWYLREKYLGEKDWRKSDNA